MSRRARRFWARARARLPHEPRPPLLLQPHVCARPRVYPEGGYLRLSTDEMTLDTEQRRNEAAKMRRVPGIEFVDGAEGRVPRIKGTGLEVFEIIKVYRIEGCDRVSVREAFHWLEPWQIQAAFDYYEAYLDEVNVRLAAEDAITEETTRAWNEY